MTKKTLRKICLSLPGTTEDVKWGADLVFSVGAKMYAVTDADEEGPFGFGVKVPEELFAELTQRDGIIPAPYLARHSWISVTNVKVLGRGEAESLVRLSYDLVFGKLSKKQQRAIRGDD